MAARSTRRRRLPVRSLVLLSFILPVAVSGQQADSTAVIPASAGSDPQPKQDRHILGVLPNYRTADGTVPFAPITTKQKFTIAMKDSFDPPEFGLAAGFALLYQAQNSNPSFGQGVLGYMHRYATSYADQSLGNLMTEAVMPTLFHEDPRYFRKINGSVMSRTAYALTRILITRTDAGGTRFNFSEFVGNSAVASIANLYYPDNRGLADTGWRLGTQLLTDAGSNVLKEFWPDIKRHFQKHHAH